VIVEELNPFLMLLACPKSKNVDTMLFSILNVYLAYDKIGYDLPYVSRVIAGDKEKLVQLSLHLLLNVLLFVPPDKEDIERLVS